MNSKNINYKLDNLFNKAIRYIHNNNIKEAKIIVKEGLKNFKDSYLLLNLHGTICLIENNNKEAVKLFDKSINLNKNFAPAYNNKGLALQKINLVEDSLEQFEKAIKIKKDYHEAYFNLARSYGILKIYDKAIDKFNKAIEIKYDYFYAYFNLAQTLIAYGQSNCYDEAEKNLRLAIKFNDKFLLAYNNLGFVLNKKKQFTKAIIELDKLLSIEPNYPDAYFNIANSYIGLNKLSDAEKNLKKVIELDKNYLAAYYEIGIVYQMSKKYKLAIENFDKSHNNKKESKILECIFEEGDKEKFLDQGKIYFNKDPNNRRISSTCNYISQQMNTENPYRFCVNPFEFIMLTNIKNNFSNDEFINDFRASLFEQDFSWEPGGRTTIKGLVTDGNLSDKKIPKIEILKKILAKEIENYKSHFSSNNSLFIKNWPKDYSFFMWSNRLQSSGYNKPHIHPGGWLSGVFYVEIPKKLKNNEGAIEFSLHVEGFKILNTKIPNKIIKPKIFDLVLFPSLTFHRTIPFKSTEERICVAFDIIPK